MNDEATPTSSGKVPGRGDYKGLYRSDPAAITAGQPGDVLPPISIGLADLLGGIDGIDHGRRRVYNLADEPITDHLRGASAEPTADQDEDAAGTGGTGTVEAALDARVADQVICDLSVDSDGAEELEL